MSPRTEPETVEGVSWAIVVLVELAATQAREVTRALESAQIIVLSEGSMLRAAVLVTAQRPHVVVAPSSLPLERTQVLRDTAKETGTEVMLVDAHGDTAEIVMDVRAAVARVMRTRPSSR
jgi:capsular polysaccharide biosynthesis protein